MWSLESTPDLSSSSKHIYIMGASLNPSCHFSQLLRWGIDKQQTQLQYLFKSLNPSKPLPVSHNPQIRTLGCNAHLNHLWINLHKGHGQSSYNSTTACEKAWLNTPGQNLLLIQRPSSVSKMILKFLPSKTSSARQDKLCIQDGRNLWSDNIHGLLYSKRSSHSR